MTDSHALGSWDTDMKGGSPRGGSLRSGSGGLVPSEAPREGLPRAWLLGAVAWHDEPPARATLISAILPRCWVQVSPFIRTPSYWTEVPAKDCL